jgi:hypothetical protein
MDNRDAVHVLVIVKKWLNGDDDILDDGTNVGPGYTWMMRWL